MNFNKFQPVSSLNFSKKNSGFTLIELIVAIGIFIIVVSFAMQGFVQTIRTQRSIATLLSANSNASSALEQMAREIRIGASFSQSETSDIMFLNAANDTVTYRLNAANRSIERDVNGAGFFSITADDVGVLDLQFILFGIGVDLYPPRITIVLRVTPIGLVGLDVPVVNMQTTVSAREFDE